MSIREFAEQAGMHSPDGFKLTVGHMAMFQLEKFAELVEAHKRERLLAGAKMPELKTLFPREMRVELLAHVSACQSAYSLESNGSRLAIAGQLEENRQALLDYVLEILQCQLCETVAAAIAHKREELLDIVYGYANHLRNDEAFQEAIRARSKA